MYSIKLEQFEGPLDLLLRLIEEQKLDITNISLAQVTDTFLNSLIDLEERRPEELADFLVVAAKLLLIKSRVLLPMLHVEDDEEIDLEQQLKIYREYYEASQRLHKQLLRRRYSFARGVSLKVAQQEKRFRPPEGLVTDHLGVYFRAVLKRLEPFVTIPEEIIQKTVNIRERILHIRERILQESTLNFQTLLQEASDKTDIIVTFLALLELVKQRTIVVVQESVFSPISIHRRPEDEILPPTTPTL